MRLLLVALTLAPLALSGCAGEADETAVPAAAPAASPPDAAAPAAADETPADAAAQEPPEPRVLSTQWNTGTVVSHPCHASDRCYSGDMQGGEIRVPDLSATKATLTVVWDASTPIAQELVGTVSLDGENLGGADGPSPLTMELDATRLREGATLFVRVLARSPGVVHDETVDATLVLE